MVMDRMWTLHIGVHLTAHPLLRTPSMHLLLLLLECAPTPCHMLLLRDVEHEP